jgi:hypothetical protein
MWQKHKFEENKIYTAKIGFTRFWVEKQQKIWRIAYRNEEEQKPSLNDSLEEVSSLPDNISWNQFIADKQNTIQFAPSLPDRPVVIKPEIPFTIMAGTSLNIYIKIPLWIWLYSSSVKPENLLYEIVSTELSSTWFGDPTSGELAYSIQSGIVQNLTEISLAPNEAVCPIQIRNESLSILHFQRLSIDVTQLNIYANQNMICTNEVKVRFRGEEQNTEVQIIQSNPSFQEDLKLIGNARNLPDKSLFRRSFYFIKYFNQY